MRVCKVAMGPMTQEEAAPIRQYGDTTQGADAIRTISEGLTIHNAWKAGPEKG